MDFPKSQSWVGLIEDRFANPDMQAGRPGSKVPAEYLNALGEEIGQVIEGQGMALQEGHNAQLQEALNQALSNVIPLGTLLPVASHLVGSGEIPASGEVSPQGFMRCDGAAIPAGNRLQGNTPNLTNGRFLRGSTLAGGTGGSESFTLSQSHLPPHSHATDHTHTASSGQAGAHSHGSSGGIQGLQWRASTPHAIYFDHSNYPGATYEYRTRRSAGPIPGWEAVRSWTERRTITDDRDVGPRDIWLTKYRRRLAWNEPAKYQLSSGSFSIQSGGAHTHPLTISAHEGQSGSVGHRAAKVHVPKYFNVQYMIKVF